MNAAPTIAPRTDWASEANRQCQVQGGAPVPIIPSQGSSLDAKSFTGTTRLIAKPIASPGKVSASGNSFHSASVKTRPSRKKLKAQYLSAERLPPNCQ